MIAPAAATIAKGLGAVCLLLGLALGWQTLRLADARTELSNEQRDRATDLAKAELAARKAVEEERAEEWRRIDDQQEVINDQKKALARARADAAAAVGSVGRLRERAAELATQCGQAGTDPATPERGTSADAAGNLLADMLGRLDKAARGIAEFATEAHIAGTTCERAYDALRPHE